jgi:hypothetical protein
LSIEQFKVAEESLISYLCGWIIRKSVICSKCPRAVTKSERESTSVRLSNEIFLQSKKYSNCSEVGLPSPNIEMFNVIHMIENAIRLKFDECCTKADVAKSLFNLIHPTCDFSFLFIRHAEHALYLSHEITKLYIIMRILYAFRFINRDLKSNAAADTKERQCVRRTEKSRKMQKIMQM